MLAVLVVAKASGITGIEAIVIAGETASASSIALIKSEDLGAKIYSVSDKDELISL